MQRNDNSGRDRGTLGEHPGSLLCRVREGSRLRQVAQSSRRGLVCVKLTEPMSQSHRGAVSEPHSGSLLESLFVFGRLFGGMRLMEALVYEMDKTSYQIHSFLRKVVAHGVVSRESRILGRLVMTVVTLLAVGAVAVGTVFGEEPRERFLVSGCQGLHGDKGWFGQPTFITPDGVRADAR